MSQVVNGDPGMTPSADDAARSDLADVEDLLKSAARYSRTGEVRASKADRARVWRTGDGQQLTASAGDWIVEYGHDMWSVTDRAFAATYAQVHDNRYRRIGEVDAVQLSAPCRVLTPEGELMASPGQWLLRNEVNDVWVVSDRHFRNYYRRV